MNIHQTMQEEKRLTSSEEVFRQLKSDIISMRLAPGSKLSEVEIAKTFDVSRQPVREAFMRLSELNLLQIRPQRATRVRKISLTELRHTRFLRAAVEVEVVRVACKVATEKDFAIIQENLDQQKIAVAQNDPDQLHELDYLFHKQICIAADCLPAFKTISENKSHTERVCTLELSDACGMKEVLEGHTDIFEALKKRDEETAVNMTRIHLRHLDGTLEKASTNFPEFFED
jgi:DNA-binding GntR family transcriptional regulator